MIPVIEIGESMVSSTSPTVTLLTVILAELRVLEIVKVIVQGVEL